MTLTSVVCSMNSIMTDIFAAKISAWSVAPYKRGAVHAVVTLRQFLNASRGPRYAAHVARVRECIDEAWRAEREHDAARRNFYLQQYKELKTDAPVALLQGVNPTWQQTGFLSYSNVMCIDIDAPKPGEPDNGNGWVTDWSALKTTLAAEIECIAYCALSVGGRGVFALVPIADPAKYAEYYDAFSRALKRVYNLQADRACSNVNRLRNMTHDPDAVINHDAATWNITLSRQAQHPNQAPAALSPAEKARIIAAVGYCVEHRDDIGFRDPTADYHDWIKLAACFAHGWNDEQGFNVFHDLAAINPTYKHRENAYKLWNLSRHHANSVGWGTFWFLMRQAGVPEWLISKRQHTAPMPRVRPLAPAEATPLTPPSTGPAPAPPSPMEAPPQVQHPTGPMMSKSERTIMTRRAAYIADGVSWLNSKRAASPALDALCRDLDLHYCGDDSWHMTDAQFSYFASNDINV